MGDRGGPDKDQIVDGLVLAFANSELSDVVGGEALRSVMRVEYHDMVEDGTFDLQQLWELLEDQPGFTPEAAFPPICLFQSWAHKLRLEMTLPDAMQDFGAKDLALSAADCRVPPAELRLLFRLQTGQRRPSRPKPLTAPGSNGPDGSFGSSANVSGGHQPTGAGRSRPPWLGWLAGVVAAASLVFVTISVVGQCRSTGGGDWSSFSASELGALPVSQVNRMGKQVSALAKSEWARLDDARKTRLLENALLRVSDRGVEVIAITDKNGRLVATVQKTRTGAINVWLR